MNRLICLSCLLLVGCGETPAPMATATPEPASPPVSETIAQPKKAQTTGQLAAPPKEAATAETGVEKVTESLVGTWEGQSDQFRLRMEFGADGTIIESADSGGGWKPINKGSFKVMAAYGETVELEIEPQGKPSYRQTDVFEGTDKFHHKHGDKVIPFVRK